MITTLYSDKFSKKKQQYIIATPAYLRKCDQYGITAGVLSLLYVLFSFCGFWEQIDINSIQNYLCAHAVFIKAKWMARITSWKCACCGNATNIRLWDSSSVHIYKLCSLIFRSDIDKFKRSQNFQQSTEESTPALLFELVLALHCKTHHP